MSLWSRLAGAVRKISRSDPPPIEPETPSEIIDRWVNKPIEELPETWANRPMPEPRELSLDAGNSLFDRYVPEDDWDNRRVREAFDRGFGNKMAETSTPEMRRWRTEFLDYLSDEGIDLEDFWPDWRNEYDMA